MIKFYDLNRLDKKVHNKILKKIKKIFLKGDYILGNEVAIFEKNFSKFIGCNYAIGCANGTDAITLALKSLKLPKNSEVIMPAMTYCSTAFAIINAGLKPVLVDVKQNKPTIDIEKINSKINNKTRVIMPVHLYGSVVDIQKIKEIVSKKKRKIYIIDDCAQAHGAKVEKLKNKRVGAISDISCFSLYPGKNLGAYGDAGIITTNNKKFHNLISNLRNLGSTRKFIHDQIGQNSRLDTIQAAILNTKIKSLDALNKKRIKIAKYYDKTIKNDKIKKLKYSKGCVYHQYVILSESRSKLIKLLNKNKIQYGFHYPYAIHQLKSLKNIFKKQKYPNSEKLAKECVSLPIDPNLKLSDLKKISKTINSF